MTNRHPAESQQDRYALRLAARLSEGSQNLPYEISERLRAARMQALARRKLMKTRTASEVALSGGGATLTLGDEGLNLWSRLGALLPLIALAAGLFAINLVQDDDRAREMADVDAALLTDDLPPDAYTDPGFLQFIKVAGPAAQARTEP
ncbi:DUF3619 family protein [Ramlibacter sp. 2FC]|uniref:DUF3619 family protein n=1 Tax=Ramlibacter sp. 2FC TaxID=2502188 RepID=UPI0010F432D3|nr:DUF3619 family protein [Ramlibacter sp. 2FC]